MMVFAVSQRAIASPSSVTLSRLHRSDGKAYILADCQTQNAAMAQTNGSLARVRTNAQK